MTADHSVTPDDAPSPGKAPARAKKEAAPASGKRRRAAAASEPARKPHGREEVVESIIDATLTLWAAQGPAKLSMRGIAARAGVNYGLVHRHFGTKDAVIRAAMQQVVARSFDHVHDSQDLVGAVDTVLPKSTGAHARLLAWATLQYVLDDVLPDKDVFLERMLELAQRSEAGGGDAAGTDDGDDTEAAIRVGSIIAMLYGWRLFKPYLARGLDLEDLDQDELDKHIRAHIMRVLDLEV